MCVGSDAAEDRHGKHVTFFKNGSVATEAHYKNGELHGPRTILYPDGSPYEICTYARDKLHGPRTILHPDGSLYKTGTYVDGKCHGIHKQVRIDRRTIVDCYGTTDETRGKRITKEEHDAEMRTYVQTFVSSPTDSVIAWMIVAKRLGICRDIARLIGRAGLKTVEDIYYETYVDENPEILEEPAAVEDAQVGDVDAAGVEINDALVEDVDNQG
jgi:hypothetical protein